MHNSCIACQPARQQAAISLKLLQGCRVKLLPASLQLSADNSPLLLKHDATPAGCLLATSKMAAGLRSLALYKNASCKKHEQTLAWLSMFAPLHDCTIAAVLDCAVINSTKAGTQHTNWSHRSCGSYRTLIEHDVTCRAAAVHGYITAAEMDCAVIHGICS